jgi:hypothetical protein
MFRLLVALWALGAGPAAAQTLLINEFLASNNSVNTDEFGDHDDWAELWNFGAAPVDLGGLWLSDGGTPWQIPTGSPDITTVHAGGYVILWFDEEPDQGPLHVDDKLSAGGESVVLFAVDGVTELDRRDFDAQTSNISEGRETDGSQVWVPFAVPTPGASNGQTIIPTLLINEFLATNTTVNTDEFGEHNDWVELWNTGDAPVDLGGLWLGAGGAPQRIPTSSPQTTTVPPGGFILVWFDEQTGQGPLHVDDELGGGGGSVVLYASNGVTEVDRRDYGAQTANVSEGRLTDGSPVWGPFPVPTPAQSNGSVALPTLLINEFLASNSAGIVDDAGEFEDWVELWNSGPAAVDLAGLWLSDGGGAWQIPAGFPESTTVPAGGFVVLWFDEDTEQGALHVDAKLGAGGESVVLFAADGQTEVDRRDFGPQVSDVSEGRQFDGASLWTSFASPTPGESNGLNDVAARERPADLRLLGVAPNPFNPSTTVEFELTRAAVVTARIHDLAGRQVWSAAPRQHSAGRHRLTWQAEAGQASGVYFLTLTAGSASRTQKLMFVQ